MDRYALVLRIAILIVNQLMMISVGLSLKPSQFRALTRIRFSVLGLLISQALLLPMIGMLAISVLPLPAHAKAALLLLAACPIGDIANFYVLLAGADVALSVALNILSCALAFVTMPIVFSAYQFLQGSLFVYRSPGWALIGRLALLSVVPLIIGMAICVFRSEFANRLSVILRYLCIAGILFLVVAVSVVQREQIAVNLVATAAGALFLIVVSAIAGLGVASVLGLKRGQLIAGAIAFPVRQIGLALAVTVSVLGHLDYAPFALIFFLVEVPLLLGLVGGYRRWILSHQIQVADLAASRAIVEGQGND